MWAEGMERFTITISNITNVFLQKNFILGACRKSHPAQQQASCTVVKEVQPISLTLALSPQQKLGLSIQVSELHVHVALYVEYSQWKCLQGLLYCKTTRYI